MNFMLITNSKKSGGQVRVGPIEVTLSVTVSKVMTERLIFR